MEPRSRILAVDDNPINIKILRETLDQSYHLVTALSGEEALEIAPQFRPDVVLLDIMMPGIDGYEICRRIRANPTLCHTKVIMVSAKALVSERLKGYQAGADDYLTKPFEEEELLAKVRVYLRLKSAEELDQLKSNVLALIGHETRTPLNGIISPAEMLALDDEMDAKERKMLAEMVCRNAKRLHAFFEKAMTLSAMKAGNVAFCFQDANPGDVVRDAVAEIVSAAQRREVTIKQDLVELPTAVIDPEQIKSALMAILDNAVRFSSPGGQVTVGGRSEDGHLVLRVTDWGEGIDPDFLPHVLDDFTGTDVRHHTEGQGLSLAIATQILLAHNGTISVQSKPGRETTFTVRLPVAAPSPAANGVAAQTTATGTPCSGLPAPLTEPIPPDSPQSTEEAIPASG